MTPEREQATRLLSTAIRRGDYADGQHLSQAELAEKYATGRSVIYWALVGLEVEGYVSKDPENRFHVNAGHLSRQLQLQRNRVDYLERCVSRMLVRMGENPNGRVLKGFTGK